LFYTWHTYKDGDFFDDIIDQCVLDAQASPSYHNPDNPIFYDAQETKLNIALG
jgi:hypothetical protein